MSLILPSWGWGHCTANLSSGTVPGAATPATAFTCGALNADGSVVTVLSALTHDVHFLVIALAGNAAGGATTPALADIMIDPAGGTSWTEAIANLAYGGSQAPVAGTAGLTCHYYFPLYIEAGSSIGIRGRNGATASMASSVVMWAFGEPSRPVMWWCGQKVETLGYTANSLGTNVTSGAANTYGSWTNIGTTTGRYGSVQFAPNAGASGVASGIYARLGYDSVILPGSPARHMNVSANWITGRNAGQGPIPCDIPSGKTLQIQTNCSTASTVFDFLIYGVMA